MIVGGEKSGTFSGGIVEDTDGQIAVPIGAGIAESGTWAWSASSGLPSLTRTSNQNATEYFVIDITIPSKGTSNLGRKITSVEAVYSCNLADTGDDIQFHVIKRSIPADGSAPSAITTVAGDADSDYNAAFDTAAERVVDTGAPKNSTLIMTVPSGDQAYIADDEIWSIRIEVIEANDATGALALIIKDIKVNYSETLA